MCMNYLSYAAKVAVFLTAAFMALPLMAQNQTSDLSPILSSSDLPFEVRLDLYKDCQGRNVLIPGGIQSYVWADLSNGNILLLAGRTGGVHGFDTVNVNNNFPPQQQNKNVFVVDVHQGVVYSRSLEDPDAGLTQDQIDSLSVTGAESVRVKNKLYMIGGYGYRNLIQDYTTFDLLTVMNINKVADWVMYPEKGVKLSQLIKQVSDPQLRVNGGWLYRTSEKNPFLIVFGQDFEGAYFSVDAVQIYTEEVRRFSVCDDGEDLVVHFLPASEKSGNYRRRDLNVVPIITGFKHNRSPLYALVALSGVFTEQGGAWTVPVSITGEGVPAMPNPNDPLTFKQGMNNYACPFLSLYSKNERASYHVLFGGITFEYFQNGQLLSDYEFPFTNEITTVKVDSEGVFTQHLMPSQYPVILSTEAHAGNRLLFGASGDFVPDRRLKKLQYDLGIFKLDKIKEPTVLGLIVGGIQSTLPNTNSQSDSSASGYIFKVTLIPRKQSEESSEVARSSP